jgi:hypothetical protein
VDHALLEAYRRTAFTAETPQGTLVLRIGETSTALDDLLADNHGTTWAYVTAWNPGSIARSAEDNTKAQKELAAFVTTAGFPFYAGEGVGDDGDWPPEPSLLILGISRTAAIDLGRRFGQVAIVYGERGAPAELVLCADTTGT